MISAAVPAHPDNRAIPCLDGLRGIAFLFVGLSHLGLELIPGGFGVTLFFFISGFLITRLLLAEQRDHGRIGLRNFYLRRLLRLAPALIVCVAVVTGVAVLQGIRPSWLEVAAALGYLQNYFNIAVILGYGSATLPLWPLWSLAVEEHYYLLFPLVLVWHRPGPALLARRVVLLAGGVLLWRGLMVSGLPDGGSYSEIATDCRIDSILYGAWLSFALAGDERGRLYRWLQQAWLPLAGLALLLISLVIRDEIFRAVPRYSLQGLGLVLLLGPVLVSQRLSWARRLLAVPPLRLAGLLSYSLYLWNWPVLTFSPDGPLSPQQVAGLDLDEHLLRALATVIIAALSYRLVERPMRRWRRRFRAETPVAPGSRPVAGEAPSPR